MDNELIKSFEPKKELNPKIWDGSGKITKIKPDVRDSLLKTANLFIDFLGVDI